MPKKRPLGVTILAIIAIIIGIFSIIGGIALMGLAVVAGIFNVSIPFGLSDFLWGIIVIVVGFIALAAGGGLLTLRMWAWWLLLIIGIVEVIIAGVSQNWIGLGLWVIIVIYTILVRKAFTSGPAQPSMT